MRGRVVRMDAKAGPQAPVADGRWPGIMARQSQRFAGFGPYVALVAEMAKPAIHHQLRRHTSVAATIDTILAKPGAGNAARMFRPQHKGVEQRLGLPPPVGIGRGAGHAVQVKNLLVQFYPIPRQSPPDARDVVTGWGG